MGDFDWMSFSDYMNSSQMLRPGHIKTLVANFYRMLGPSRAARVERQFNQLRDLNEKFTFLWNLPEAYQCLILPRPKTRKPLKAEDTAERLKTQGNIYYKKKQLDDALNFYSSAILVAPHPELSIGPISSSSGNEKEKVKLSTSAGDMTKYKTLAFCYANRAAVLLEMKKYDKCLQDIELALESGYPELLKSKLLERKERCLRAQKQENAGGERVERELPVLSEPNKTIPSLSSAVKLAYSMGKGRHVVAVKDIQPGDVIAVEESSFTLIHFQHLNEYCLVCSRISDAPLPCPVCLKGFCSETCRTIGLRDFHRKECKVYRALVELGFEKKSYVVIALKILLRTPFAEMKEKFNVLQQEVKELSPEKLGFDSKGIYNSADYRTVFHMPSALAMKSEQRILKTCLIAVVLTKLLCEVEGVSFDSHNLPANIFPDIVTKGMVIIQLLVNQPILRTLKTLEVDIPFPDAFFQVLGTGIFPSVGLMNHSCCASAFGYNIGPVVIVRAIGSIPAGNEVTIAYCPQFEELPKIFRKQSLQNLNLTCSCKACLKDWPLEDELPFGEFLCIKCSETLKMNTCNKCEINYENPDYQGEKRDAVKQWQHRLCQFKQAEVKFRFAEQKVNTEQLVTKAEFDDVCKFAVMLENNVKFPNQMYLHVKSVMVKYFVNY